MGTKVYDNALDLITFSRNSGGTSLRKISYGDELVTNGTFDTDSDWTTQSGWNIDGGVASYVGGTGREIDQTISTSASSVYLVEYEITSLTSGRVGFYSAESSKSAASYEGSEVGVYSHVVTATGSSMKLRFRTDSTSANMSIDNVSVKEVLFDQPDGTLTLFNHPADIPRIDYSPDGTAKGLLIEEQRTNLVVKSQEIASGSDGWFTAGATTSSNQVGPDGSVNSANIITSDTSTGQHALAVSRAFTSGLSYTGSFFVKKGTQRYIRISAGNTGTWAARVNFDLDLGVVESNISGTGQIQNLGDDWYRCSITGDALASASTALALYLLNDSKSDSFTGVGTETVIVFGAQLEAGAFPTSYIPTSGSTVTRAADVASIPVSAFGYNQSAGTVVVNTSSLSSTLVSNPMVYNLNNNTSVERIYVLGVSDQWRLSVTDNNVTQAAILAGNYGEEKIASSFKENKFNHCVNGTLGAEDSSGTMPTVTDLDIGNQIGGNLLNGHIKSIQYFPRRLSNAQLVELTS